MIDNRIVSVNTPRIVESRTEVVTKSGTRSYQLLQWQQELLSASVCKIPIFFSISPNGKMNVKTLAMALIVTEATCYPGIYIQL